MRIVTDEMNVGKRNILFFKDEIPLKPFNSIIIDKQIYKADLPNDLPNAVAIESDQSFLGKEFNFAMIYD